MSAASLTQFLLQESATRYTYVAAECLMVWDILLTLDEEIAHVWFAPWTLGKAMFFLNRYCPPILFVFDLLFLLAPDLSVQACKLLFIGPGITGIIVFASIEYTLVLRIHALYRSRALHYFLTVLCLVSAGTMTGTTIYWYSNISWVSSPGAVPLLSSCGPQCTKASCHTLLVLFWVPLFFFEIVVSALTIYDTWRNRHMARSGSGSKLLSIVYRDGLLYYLMMIGISTSNLLIWIAAPQTLYYLAASLMRSTQSLACSR